jgi:histidinol-phosphatase (PHP family)
MPPVTDLAVPVPLADCHVHTQWSWDAEAGDMMATCERALDAGLRVVAFTEHADFNELDSHPRAVVDMPGYLESIAECRERFPTLVIQTGVELGQPHLHTAETAALLAAAPDGIDRVLGSVHVAMVDGQLVDVSGVRPRIAARAWPDVVRSSLSTTLDLVTSGAPFEVLAHLDYAKRYWPHDEMPYDETVFTAEYHAVLEAAARRGLVLEINTTRGAPAQRGLGPGLPVLRQWHQLGGAAVSFGSDSHDPTRVGRGLAAAASLAHQAGFHPDAGDGVFWGRRRSV